MHIDIGLAPLRDRLHNRAKSNLKFLEFSALKTPLIASPVEPYKDTPARMAWSEEKWIENMEYLITNEKMRRVSGNACYDIVKSNFNTEKIAKNYLTRLKAIIKEHRHDRNAVLTT